MTWYAIRTAPGAQMPHRDRWPEPNASALKAKAAKTTVRGKGYRMASSVNPVQSKIECALEDAGFMFYMPAEYVAARNRRNKGLFEVRRFALMKGYVFIGEMETGDDWARLLGAPGYPGVLGIQGVVTSIGGEPFPINAIDLHRLRMYELNSRLEAEAKVAKLIKNDERGVREKRKIAVRGARKKLFPGRSVKLIWGGKVGREATVQAWHDQDQVRVLLQELDASSETISVPYEYLKVVGE